MNNDLTHDLTGAYASVKASAFEAGYLSAEAQELENIRALKAIEARQETDWIEKVISWAVFAILCAAIIVFVSGCAGAYVPKCEHVKAEKDKFAVTNTPCSRTIQYEMNSEKVNAICVAGTDNVVRCQEAKK